MAGTFTKAGRYEVVRELGRGSMGVVYQGYDPVIGRTVAVKTMLTEGLTPEEFREYRARFQREAQAAGVLSHPSIVNVFDYGEDGGMLYLIMEYLEGKSLEKLVEGGVILPIETIIPMCEQVCGALDHAHQRGIVHRDIKPANIMILDSGMVKVTDFGIAKMVSMGMTQAGLVLGTPNYMSPEQVKGRPVDGRSDIFSLGVVLYDLVTGEMPFSGQNITTVIYKIINENPIPPRELDATIHPGLSYVICKALAKSPDERYQTCGELAYDLKNFKLHGGQTAPSSTAIFKGVPTASPDLPSPAKPPQKPATQPVAAAETARPAPQQQSPKAPAPVQVIAPAPSQKKERAAPMAWGLVAVVVLLGILGGGYWYLSKGRQHTANPQSQTANLQTQLPGSEPQAAGPQPAASNAALGQSPSESKSLDSSLPRRAPDRGAKVPAEKPAVGKERSSNKPSDTPEATTPASPAGRAPSLASPASNGGGPAAAPKVGQLMIASNVPGAKITVDGSSGPSWVTPYSSAIERPAGTHNVIVSKDGYDDYQQFVSVEAGKTYTVNAQLAEAKGDVVITTTPPGLEVTIDGKLMGPSPVRTTLPVGEHKYTVKRAGWEPYEGSFAAKSGAVITVKVNMGS